MRGWSMGLSIIHMILRCVVISVVRSPIYGSFSQKYWLSKLKKWASTHVRTCGTGQQVKPLAHEFALLASLPFTKGCWESISMEFLFGLPKNSYGNTGIVVLWPFEQDGYLEAVPYTIDGLGTNNPFLDHANSKHCLPVAMVSDRNPCFANTFWAQYLGVLHLIGRFHLNRPQIAGLTERLYLLYWRYLTW